MKRTKKEGKTTMRASRIVTTKRRGNGAEKRGAGGKEGGRDRGREGEVGWRMEGGTPTRGEVSAALSSKESVVTLALA